MGNVDEKVNLTGAARTSSCCKQCFHQPSEVSLNFSLLFFFRHFHGLKILPRVENFPPFRFGVLSPVLPPSPTIVLWCCSASSSKRNPQFSCELDSLGAFECDNSVEM